ncbi:hypothetical protein ABT299_20150 [Spirillospora sp. NPDC000708]
MKIKDRIGAVLLGTASTLLVALAGAMGYVSYAAQAAFVEEVKGPGLDVHLEALGLDVASVVFALLGLVAARLGKQALTERTLNVACVGASVGMNALAAPPGSAPAMVAYVMPAVLYAATSDRLIATVRMRFLETPAEVPIAPETPVEPSPVREVPQTLPELVSDPDALPEPTERDLLAAMPSDAARVRYALEVLGLDAKRAEVQEYLAERGFEVPANTVYNVQSQERRRAHEEALNEAWNEMKALEADEREAA